MPAATNRVLSNARHFLSGDASLWEGARAGHFWPHQEMSIFQQARRSASEGVSVTCNMVDEMSQSTLKEARPLERRQRPLAIPIIEAETAFGHPRDFLDNSFVYLVVSPRARGLSVGVNLNPDKWCNFDCIYCEVHRNTPSREQRLNVDVMAAELRKTLAFVYDGRMRERPGYENLPEELIQLRHVTLSGDGEPTLAPNFIEAIEALIHIRAMGGFPFFKLVLITNATGLDQPAVQGGLRFFTRADEVWAKLDGGTQDYLSRINKLDVPLEKILSNILSLARQRPVIIQSLFPAIDDAEPPAEEIQEYVLRLKDLKEAGAQIPLVQIYSATRPTPNSRCGHLPLKTLSRIAQTVRQVAGLHAEVF
jgi:wyosine [tRNA(Phe)-imidazoG37] synthetase (radical SAM superfamily)